MVDSFISYLEKEKRYSPLTLEAYQMDLIQFSRFLLLQYSLNAITQSNHMMIRSWIADLSCSGLDHRSIRRKLSCLKSYFKWALYRKLINKNPMHKVVSPKLKKGLPEVIQVAELMTVINSDQVQVTQDFSTNRDKLIVALFYHLGIRRAELLTLRLNDISLIEQKLKVIGKGSKERIIPFGDELKMMISRYINMRGEFIKVSNPYLIVTNTGNQAYPKLINRVVAAQLKGHTTISKKSPHSIRHSFATHLADSGAEINAIKNLLGHSSLAATQVYTHLAVEKLKDNYQHAHPRAHLKQLN